MQAASALVCKKEVTLQTYGKDKDRRTHGEVLLPDGTNATTRWSKMAGAGGIGSMHWGIRSERS